MNMNDTATSLVCFVRGIGLFFRTLREMGIRFFGMDAASDGTAENNRRPFYKMIPPFPVIGKPPA
jgi:hypothetical protein